MIFHKVNQSKQSAFNVASKVRKPYGHCPSHQGLSLVQSVVGLTPKFTSLCYWNLLLQSTFTSTEQRHFVGVPVYSSSLPLSIKLMQFTEENTFSLLFLIPSSPEGCGRAVTVHAFPTRYCCRGEAVRGALTALSQHDQERRCSLLSLVCYWPVETW